MNDILDYDQSTGAFRWKVSRGGTARAGSLAGTPQVKGYISIIAKGKAHLAHRLAWEMVVGPIPAGMQIDHINGDRTDNRIANLRVVSGHLNQQNRKRAASHSKTGVLGVSPVSGSDKFLARLRVDGRNRHLGCFRTVEEAHQAYVEAKRRLHAGCTL